MKNTKMKKFLVVVLSAALVAGLAAGCGSKEDGKEEDKGSSAKTAKVIDVDLTNEEYAFGIDKDQPELVEHLAWISAVLFIFIMVLSGSDVYIDYPICIFLC